MSTAPPLINLPKTHQRLDFLSNKQKGFIEEWLDWIGSFFVDPPKPGLFESTAPLPKTVSAEDFSKYVGNLALDLKEIENFKFEIIEERTNAIRILAAASVIEQHAKAWMKAHEGKHNFTAVQETFIKADQLRERIIKGAPKHHYSVPDNPKSKVSTPSLVGPGIYNKGSSNSNYGGNNCYLISLMQGVLGDPITRRYIVDGTFRLDPEELVFQRYTQKNLDQAVNILRECASLYEEATRYEKLDAQSFILKLRDALNPLVKDSDLSKGKQEDPTEVLEAILANLSPDNNKLFHQSIREKVFKLDEGQEDKLEKGRRVFTEFYQVLTDYLRELDPLIPLLNHLGQPTEHNNPVELLQALAKGLAIDEVPDDLKSLIPLIHENLTYKLELDLDNKKVYTRAFETIQQLKPLSAKKAKKFLTAIDSSEDYRACNELAVILRAILIKFKRITEKEYRKTLLEDVMPDLIKTYTKEGELEKNIAEKELQIVTKTEENQELLEAINTYPENVLIKDVKKEIESRLQLPENSPSGWRNSLTVERKVALPKVDLASSPESNAFESFLRATNSETEDDGNYVQYLEKTDQEVRLEIKTIETLFETTPNVALFQLKRYSHDNSRNIATKVSKKVHLKETFYLDPDLTKDGRGGEYEIRWFVVHVGARANSGHYVHYRKCMKEGRDMWHYFNDGNTPTIADQKKVEAGLQDCCLIFAARKNIDFTREEIKERIAERVEEAKGKSNAEEYDTIVKDARKDTTDEAFIKLFRNEFKQENPQLDLLKKIYGQLAKHEFKTFIDLFVPLCAGYDKEKPTEEQILLLKTLTTPYFLDSKVNKHIVDQYIDFRLQRRQHRLDDIIRKISEDKTIEGEKRNLLDFQAALNFENRCIEHLLHIQKTVPRGFSTLVELHCPTVYTAHLADLKKSLKNPSLVGTLKAKITNNKVRIDQAAETLQKLIEDEQREIQRDIFKCCV